MQSHRHNHTRHNHTRCKHTAHPDRVRSSSVKRLLLMLLVLAALALLVAESDPTQKETLIRLIMNMLAQQN